MVDKDAREARRAAALKQSTSTDPERQKYITQQAKERAQQKSDRAKILQEIENDKAERKTRAERQQQSASEPAVKTESKPINVDGMTKVSVRLPDSRILRREFEQGKTLDDVRSWIDEMRNDHSAPPYVLQTTFPTRTYEVSEERKETLHSILGKGGQVIMKVSPPPSILFRLCCSDFVGD